MTINYGIRQGGDYAQQALGNQAGFVGDTLYIPYATFDTGGSSEAQSTLAVTDIEIFKNGGITSRATDSGIHLGDTGTAGDTGQYGDRAGLNRFSIRIYNNTDDTGFYDAGSQYHVAIDSVTLAGKTVRHFPAVFELGTPRANIVEVLGDTGAAHLDQGKFGVLSDSGVAAAVVDTGKVSNAVWNSLLADHRTAATMGLHDTGGTADAIWAYSSRVATSVSGAVGSVTTVSANAVDTGSFTGTAAFANDTGALVNKIWAATDRQLTAFALDTGVANTVWKESTSTYTADTGSVAYAQGRLMAVKGDTGAAHLDAGRLGVTATSSLDTGATKDAVWGTAPGTSDRYLTGSANVDTGVADTVWKSSHSTYTDTGSLGYGVNVSYLRTDTGAADVLSQFAGIKLSVTGQLDTGTYATGFLLDTGDVKDTVWQTAAGTDGAGALGTTLDTGLSDAVWKYSTSGATGDTGSVGYAQGRLMAVKGDTGAAHLDAGRLGTSATATLDTGGTKDAVWGTAPGTDGPGTIGTVLDTGLADAFWKYSTSLATGDTGSVGYAQGRLMAVKGDTGAAHLDAGRLGVSATATLDTGATKDAVWQTLPGTDGRGLTESLNIDTGIADTVWKYSTSLATGDTGSVGYAQGRLMAAHADTGAVHIVSGRLAATDSGTVAAVLDTGKVAAAVWTNHAVRTATSVSGAVGSVSGNVDGSVASVTTVSANAVDTGSFTGTAAFANDTGALVNKIWAATDRQLTAFALDTGVANTVWKESTSTYTGDTGSVAYAQGRLMAVKGDTGAAHLDAGRLGTSAPAAALDTGATKDAVWGTTPGVDGAGTIGTVLDTGLADAFWKYSTSNATGDTGSVGYAQGRLMAVKGDTGAAHLDAGRLGVTATASLDTGATKDAVWGTVPGTSTRYLTGSENIDTGVANQVWKESTSVYTADTGSVAYAQGRLMAVHGDTGAANIISGRLAATDSGVVAAVLDTGKVAAAVWTNHATRTATSVSGNVDGSVASVTTVSANAVDTGSFTGTAALANDTGAFVNSIWGATSRVATSVSGNVDGNVTGTVDRVLTFNHDTGVTDTVWKASQSTYTDTGSLGYGVNVSYLRTDTGAADRLLKFAGTKLSDSGTLDTGSGTPGGAASALDTGATKDAVWGTAPGTDGPGTIGTVLDTGLADAIWKYSTSGATADTGSVGYAQGRLMAVKGDTGAAHLDAGRLGVTATASLDTGATKDAVWGTAPGTSDRYLTGSANVDTGVSDTVWKQAARTLTSFAHDTGVANTVWKESPSTYTGDTGSAGYAQGRLMAAHGDTGAVHIVSGRLAATDSGVVAAVLDTGKVAAAVWTNHATRVATAVTGLTASDVGAIKAETDKMTFTVANQIDANIQYVNDVAVAGTGDTGLADTWRPA